MKKQLEDLKVQLATKKSKVKEPLSRAKPSNLTSLQQRFADYKMLEKSKRATKSKMPYLIALESDLSPQLKVSSFPMEPIGK